jgi:hypothetical protein
MGSRNHALARRGTSVLYHNIDKRKVTMQLPDEFAKYPVDHATDLNNLPKAPRSTIPRSII